MTLVKCNDPFCLGDIYDMGACVHCCSAEDRIHMVRASTDANWLHRVVMDLSVQRTVTKAALSRQRKVNRWTIGN